jgi:transcriptional regulator with XRE-family HTH domain
MPARAPDPLLAAFGSAVREFRRARGLSQERLAEVAGIHRTYIGDVERGVRNVSLVNIVRIARALSVEASTLLATMERR